MGVSAPGTTTALALETSAVKRARKANFMMMLEMMSIFVR